MSRRRKRTILKNKLEQQSHMQRETMAMKMTPKKMMTASLAEIWTQMKWRREKYNLI